VTSLRKHLLVWLIPVFLASAVIAAVWTYYMFGSMVSMFMDGQMRVLADSHAAETLSLPTLRQLTDHEVSKGSLIVQIWDGQGRLLTTSYPSLVVPLQAENGFEDLQFGTRHWRIYSGQARGAGATGGCAGRELHQRAADERCPFRDQSARRRCEQAAYAVARCIYFAATVRARRCA
jgi:hypothetical protein